MVVFCVLHLSSWRNIYSLKRLCLHAKVYCVCLFAYMVQVYLNIDTSGRHVRKRSSNRVGEAANQHEKNIWLREAVN
ncbi:hypothetical protein IGI04_004816 [Brassica rapa subsp. trilocularis]|uniref:Secreted protein n=1 Tax=Brassica rapa subsp. trilocularis TaxID=1813537 RepID=A0ABQ7NC74_BRACM|nr:hypothetical protein IGI04_004816 [Brassica rapa subsp. trilocularis]